VEYFPRSLARCPRLLPFSSKEIANGDGTKTQGPRGGREGEQKQQQQVLVRLPACLLPLAGSFSAGFRSGAALV